MTPEADRPEARTSRADALREHGRVVRERRWVIAACVALLGTAALLYSLLATPVYRASATIQIERRSPEVLTFTDPAQPDPSGYFYDFYETQYRIIQSRSVLTLAAERLDLANRPSLLERKGSALARLKRWASSLIAPPSPEPAEAQTPRTEADPDAGFAGFIAAGLSVDPVRQSRLVQVSFEDRDPALAREVVDAVAHAFVEFNLTARSSTTELATEFLTREVQRIQAEIHDMEQELQAYGSRESILALSDGATDLAESSLAELDRHLSEARRRQALASARLESLDNAAPESLEEVRDSPLILKLEESLAVLEQRHAQMSGRFRPGWPELAELTAEIEQSRQRLRAEVARIAAATLETARSDHEQALAEVRNLTAQVDSQKREVQRVRRAAIDYAALQAEIESRRKLLGELVSRRSETRSSGELYDTGSSNIRIVDKAFEPTHPVRPRRLRNTALGLLTGLFLGLAAAFLLDHLDNTIKDESDLARHAPALPVLAHVPALEPLRVVGEPEVRSPDLASHEAPRSAFGEAFKNLRTSILLAFADTPPRHILVTSCEPESGKSTTSQNLAVVLAQSGKRVLLIDADLRKPRLHRTFGLGNRLGLSNYLSGNVGAGELVLETEVPGVSLIASGPIPPNPSELLNSPRLIALLGDLDRAGSFDVVVIDCPPLLQVADALILAARADATVLVVRAGVTTREALAGGLRRLEQARATPIGMVLNGATARARYYYRERREDRDEETAPAPGRERRHRRRA